MIGEDEMKLLYGMLALHVCVEPTAMRVNLLPSISPPSHTLTWKSLGKKKKKKNLKQKSVMIFPSVN